MLRKILMACGLVLAAVSANAQYTATYVASRSEFPNPGDVVYNLHDPNEGTANYYFYGGNGSGYYQIDASNGTITFSSTVPATLSRTRQDNLEIGISTNRYLVQVVDGFCNFVGTHPGYIMLTNREDQYLGTNSYTAWNHVFSPSPNTTINTDYRIAILVKPDVFPAQTVVLWDVPGKSAGGPVWGFVNMIWGNWYGTRSDLAGFPFSVGSISTLTNTFNWQQLWGGPTNNAFRVELNQYFFTGSTLQPWSDRTGDFNMVFHQAPGGFIPQGYAVTISTNYLLGGHSFVELYNQDSTTLYETRRVIIKNSDDWFGGAFNLNRVYNQFVPGQYIRLDQTIPNIQFGLEIVQGFGAVRINNWNMVLKTTGGAIVQ